MMFLPLLPTQQTARLDHSFTSLFTCTSPYRSPPSTNTGRLTGALRAMCRICANISNLSNNLTLGGNYQCVPSSGDRYLQSMLSCLQPTMYSIPECSSLFTADPSKISVSATANVTQTVGGSISLFYLAMAFRSVSLIL